jgi:hypothetical protein
LGSDFVHHNVIIVHEHTFSNLSSFFWILLIWFANENPRTFYRNFVIYLWIKKDKLFMIDWIPLSVWHFNMKRRGVCCVRKLAMLYICSKSIYLFFIRKLAVTSNSFLSTQNMVIRICWNFVIDWFTWGCNYPRDGVLQ